MNPKIYTPQDHPLSPEDFDSDAVRIVERLSHNGYFAAVVGGGVRDLLLGKPPKDFDIATDATPRRIKSLFSNSRIIGRRFRLVHVFFPGNKNIEVSTFRDTSEEIAEPIAPPDHSDQISHEADNDEGEASLPATTNVSRLDDNIYGTEETDALRRDLTINGLFYDVMTNSIIDYVGGMEDLKARIVRVIGDPDVRFLEDPVRLLRVVRHAARTDFTIDPLCYESVQRNCGLLRQSSAVRVYEELRKDFSSGHALSIVRLLFQTSLLSVLLPEITEQMLASGSLFTECLERVDELNQAGEQIQITIPLALIAIFADFRRSSAGISDSTGWDPHQVFDREESISEYLAMTFQSLAIPRKERERVEAMLRIWSAAVNGEPIPHDLGQSIIRHQAISETIGLIRVLPMSNIDRPTLKLLSEVRDSQSHDDFRPARKRRRTRRRRSGDEPGAEPHDQF